MKLNLSILALALGLSLTGVAQATVVAVGDSIHLAPTSSTDLGSLGNALNFVPAGSGSSEFTTAVYHDTSGSFTDTWLFHVDSPLASEGFLTIFKTKNRDITGLTAELWSETTAGAHLSIGDLASVSANQFYGAGAFPTSGDFRYIVKGTATGSLGGRYDIGVTISSVTTPVPEPESYAMLLAGLGVLGAVARRRMK